MKIAGLLEFTKKMIPNEFGDEELIFMLNSIEGRIQTEVLRLSKPDIVSYTVDDTDKELIVEPPFDDIYFWGLKAEILRHRGEWNEYANVREMYREIFDDLLRHHRNTYGFPESTEEE